MNILIIGNGAREYSIALALKKDKNVRNIYFASGNGATSKIATNIDIKDYNKLVEFAKSNNIDLTIVGPEQPLVDGIVDIFKANGLVIFGSSKEASKLEGSKAFMKNFLKENGILTAKYIESSSIDEINNFIDELNTPIVVKADGLCAGKGVIIAKTHTEAKEVAKDMLSGSSFGEAGARVVIEEFLDGYELSVFAICDGENYKILPAVQDHKRLLDNDEGPNTGGMGTYSPTPLIDEVLYQKIEDKIVKPTIDGMKKRDTPFEGVLFIGLMIVKNEPFTLEFNVRFGDPECEVLMPLLKTPMSELFYKSATKKLNELNIEFSNQFAVAVVKASKDYPYKNSTPSEIFIDEANIKNGHISFAGVSEKDGKLYASGGRVLVCVGIGDSVKDARDNAYEIAKYVKFDGEQFRKDIAYQAIK